MLGVILCGGQSTRMGTDKGMLTIESSTWVQTACEKLQQVGIPVVISVNSDQYSRYAESFDAGQLVVDHPQLNIKGPLCGVLSVHLQYPGQDFFVLACDMPLMKTDLLLDLWQHYNDDSSSDAYLFLNDHQPEPLCAIYTHKGLATIYQLYLANSLTRYSMKFALEQLHVSSKEISEEQKEYFRNFNAHAEINGL